ncbi:MAG TPA: hypothetical protein VIP80_09325 [Gemmatimonadales bacterium]|jgi:hypothetical protein
MRIPWIVYAGTASSILPVVAGLLAHRRLTPARRWILAWAAFVVLANLLTTLLAWQDRNNHWVNYLATPVAGGLALWALSHWQQSSLAALSMRLAVPLLAITWIGIVVRFENTKTFSLLAEPFAGLLVMAAATYTLISRAFTETGNVLGQAWFWIALGLTLVSGLAVALPPTSYWLLARHPDLVVKAYEVKSALEILALLLIARGMLCPTPVSPFGGSFSRASSPSPSSSSASSSRW